MKITIDEGLCKEAGLDLPSVLAVLLVKSCDNIPELLDNLKAKEVLVESTSIFGKSWAVTQRWDDVVAGIVLDSEVPNVKDNDQHLEELARKLMAIFPNGKKPETSLYWKGNTKDTKLRLKKFFKLYGNKFSDDELINAATKYVESFNGNYQYMRVLKYFIWKDERKMDSEGKMYIEEVSELASFMENAGQTDANDSWMDNIR